MLLTLANLLTALRFACIVPAGLTIVHGHWAWASAIFATAVITDLLDGKLARRFHATSRFGGFFDHLTDALFVAASLAALAAIGLVTWLLPVLVLAAFGQYVMDSRVLAGQPLRTSWLGRNNGVAYFVAVGVPVIREGLDLAWPGDAWVSGLAWLLVVTTLISMTDRARALLVQRPPT